MSGSSPKLLVLIGLGLAALAPFRAPFGQDVLDLEAEDDDDDLDAELREPDLLLYVPFDGTSDAYAPGWTDRTLTRVGNSAMTYAFVPGLVGQARGKGPAGYAGVAYPIPGNINLPEGTLSLWFRWDKNTEKGPFGSFISPDIFALSVSHDVLKSIRQDGEWHHIALTWKRKERAGTVFLDAKEVLTVEMGEEWYRRPLLDELGNPLPVRHNMLIADGLPGSVDEVYIWDMALSHEDMETAWRRGKAGRTSWPKEVHPEPKPWRPLAGLLSLGDKRKSRVPVLSLDKARQRQTPARTYISLDGQWRCQPLGWTKYVPTSMVEDEGFFGRRERIANWWPVRGAWTSLNVPGTWQATSEVGAPPTWNGSPLTAYYGAICERDLEVPAELAGKGLFLRIAGEPFRYGRTALPVSIFANNRFVGESMASEGVAVDLTDAIEAGKTNRIALLLGNPSLPAEQTTLGRVTLEVHAARDVVVEYAYVTPQGEPERLDLIVEMTKTVEGELPLQLECEVWDWPDGKERKSLGKRALTIPAESDPWHPVSFEFPNPRRWHPEDPHMYNLAVRASHPDGRLIDEGESVRFGFRTVTTRGRELILNGKPFHMRGMSHNSPGPGEGGFKYKRSIGQNADRCLAEYLNRWRQVALDACDREGWLQCYHIDFNPAWRGSESRGRREQFWGIMKTVWNHPAVIAWQRWGNGFVNGPHGHPRQIGGAGGIDYDPENDWHKRVRAVQDLFHKNAPGRLFFYYRLGVGGDFRGIMHYMGWGTPIQAREEWPSYWSEHCNEPFSLTEGGLPMFSNDYLWQWGRGRGKTPFSGSTGIIEHGARYFGDAMYEYVSRDMAITLDFTDNGREIEGVEIVPLGDVNPDFLDKMPIGKTGVAEDEFGVGDIDEAIMADEGKSQTGIPLSTHADTTSAYKDKDETEGQAGRWDFEFDPVQIHYHPAYYRLKRYAVRRTLCAWRTYGISYLIHCCFKRQMLWSPGSMKLNPIGREIARYNSAAMLYIGGPPGDFVLKDHAFTSGEKVAKQIIVRNDHFSPARVAATWRVIDLADEGELASGEVDVTVGVGALHKAPISFTAPAASKKRHLRTAVSYTVNGEERQDESFDLQVFPKKVAFSPATTKVGLIDPTGDTAEMLKKVGQPFKLLAAGGSLDGLDLLIIGRKGYTEETRKLLDQLKVREAIGRGMNVVIFEQTCRRVMGLLNEHFDNRNAFIRDRESGLLRGLTDEDFAEWRGETDLVEAYPDWDRESNWMAGKYSKHGAPNEFGQGRFYHWSNKGMVCTYSYNKPQVGNFRLLLENAFDVAFTPLLEQRIGDGRILFCQLDVTNRYGTDPVASMLVDRMLEEYAAKRPAQETTVGYLGGPEGKKTIAPLGLALKDVTDLASEPQVGILIICPDEAVDALKSARANVETFLKRGGKLVVLPVGMGTQLDWLPCEVKRERGEAFITRNLAESPLLRGLASADFFWRRCVRCVRVSSDVEGAYNADSGLICSAPVGKGQVVLCQIQPAWFEWCWQQGKVTRIWSTLLRNLGAVSTHSVDPLCADDSAFSHIYHVKPLPFDPDGHRVW